MSVHGVARMQKEERTGVRQDAEAHCDGHLEAVLAHDLCVEREGEVLLLLARATSTETLVESDDGGNVKCRVTGSSREG